MVVKRNFILKVEDVALKDINKALKDAGINPVSIMEIYKEEIKDDAEEQDDVEAQT